MPVSSFELESSIHEDDEEFASLVTETVDGQQPQQPSLSSLHGSDRRLRHSDNIPVSGSGKKKYAGVLLIVGLIFFIVAYPRGNETIEQAADTLDKPETTAAPDTIMEPTESSNIDQENDEHHDSDNDNDEPSSAAAVVPAETTGPAIAATPEPVPAAAIPTETPAPIPSGVARPGTGPIGAPGWKMSPSRLSPKYLPKGQPMDPAGRQEMIDTWGQWTFVDPKAASDRPQDDFYAQFPNRDVPRDQFPPNAWQLDTDYMSKFLDASLDLVTRAQEAILGEYGHSKFDMPNVDFDERSKMFYVNLVDFRNDTWASDITVESAAGWHDKTGWENVQRRILHAIMTEDSFTYLMGGHSAAAGHGNHYWQSYTLQLNKVIEPVFARLGVFFKAHNVGMGGLGTGHNAMGAKDIYGDDIDILYWDSGMTERDWPHVDLFLRANMISGRKVPAIWGSLGGEKLREFAQKTGADVGIIAGDSAGYLGVPQATSLDEVSSMPFAVQYLSCISDLADECNAFKYNVQCWIDRPDVTPATGQLGTNPGGQVGWHPGWRHHQIHGRTQAFALLRAIRQALKRWKEAEGNMLPDEEWHMSGHYDDVRSKTLAYESADCLSLPINDLFCKYPMNSKTEFTPRVNGYDVSLRRIMKLGGVVPMTEGNHYDPPDVRLTHAEIPEGSVDALNIIENGVDFVTNRARERHVDRLLNPVPYEYKSQNYITPGRGTSVSTTVGASDNCDGTWDSFCNRARESQCLLLHHNDGRNGLLMDGVSGWIVLDIANVEKGLIVVKIETWHATGENPRTNGWTCENNECSPGRHLAYAGNGANETSGIRPKSEVRSVPTHELRQLKAAVPQPCPDFRFEFAIDGMITSWTKDEFESHRTEVERVVNVWELLNDPSYVAAGAKDIELAIRLTGCGRLVTHSLTHVYWA